MKENMHMIPVVKILQTLTSELKGKTRGNGLKNQGATCYLNFLSQTLFFA